MDDLLLFKDCFNPVYACAFIVSLPKNYFLNYRRIFLHCTREYSWRASPARAFYGGYFESALEASFFKLTLTVDRSIFEKSIVDVFFAGAGWVLFPGVWYLF